MIFVSTKAKPYGGETYIGKGEADRPSCVFPRWAGGWRKGFFDMGGDIF